MSVGSFKSFCMDKLHTCVNCEQFMDYLMPTDCYDTKAHVDNIKLTAPFATEELCVVFLTSDINFLIDNGYVLQHHARISYVVAQKQGRLEIMHLHFSLPQTNLRYAQLHGKQEADNLYIDSRSKQAAVGTEGAATAAGMYSPNGLIFYQLSGKEQINLVNASLYNLLGYEGNKDLFSHTQRSLEKLLLPQDWPRVQQQLQQCAQGHVFNMNVTFLRKDGSPVKVLLRGNYVENHNQFYILSLTPLVVPPCQLDYGDFSLERKFSEDYSISYELFLKISLDIFKQYGRKQGIPHLLELSTVVLNADNGWICDVRELDKPATLLYGTTVPGNKKIPLSKIPSRYCLYFCHRFNTNAFNNYEEMPEPIRSLCRRDGTNSFMFNIITVRGKESFILYFLRQQSSKPWTKNEQKIMQYTSKMFALLLEGYAHKHPVSDSLVGGAQ
ncbi:MAG: PAS domain-containing protein, partial [Phascolarctobacterium sp.]